MRTPTVHRPAGIPRRGGFTLVEILVVILILGIISAVAVPQVGSANDLRCATAARVVMADLMYAQSRAISTQKSQYLIFDVANKQIRLADATSPEHLLVHPTRQTAYIVQFGPGSSTGLDRQELVSADFDDRATLGFDSLGTPFTLNEDGTTAPLVDGKVVVRCASREMTIKVIPFTGEIVID